MTFMQFACIELLGQDYYVSRSGYAGEDGYEVPMPAARAEALVRCLLAEPGVAPIGFDVCDSLRLETSLCLYGHDMGSAATPAETSLGWAISRTHRADGVRTGGFPGAEWISAQQAQGIASKRVGLLPQEWMPVRESAEIVDAQGRATGKVSSGGFGPSPDASLAMGYMPNELAGLGSEVTAIVRGKPVTLVVSKMSSMAQRYYHG